MKLNRNDTCWCGSEKKYKKCHLESDQEKELLLAQLKKEGHPLPPRSVIRTPAQIKGIKQACKLTKSILDDLGSIIKPGITTDDVNTIVHEKTIAAGATPAPLNYRGFPKSCCTSLNEVICHGIPSDRKLVEGDNLNVDVTCILNGYYGDSCRMYEVGTLSQKAKQLNKVTKECLIKGIEAVKPYESVGRIGDAIEKHAKKHGYSVVEMFGGHGVGVEFHEDPFVFHYSRDEKQMILLPNMTLTIEPMINEGVPDGEILDDDWTAVTADGKLSSQWEHTILVTETGAEILT